MVRIVQMSGWRGEWEGVHIGISNYEIERYFILSLASWIACVILDGTLVLNIFRAYDESMRQMMRDFCTKWSPVQTVEKVGLFISFVSMVNLGIDVYRNLHHLTSDMSLYIWFFLCVICKISRVLIQGDYIRILLYRYHGVSSKVNLN